jgi:SAM-dependent methyltransferase
MTRDPRDTFSRSAGRYLESSDHQAGPDLELISSTAEKMRPGITLDIACGAGHALLAAAQYSGLCLAADLTLEMLKVTRTHLEKKGVASLACLQSTAEFLPLATGSVSLVTCRIAPHHFSSVPSFLFEVERVLAEDGTAIVIDSIVPDEPFADMFLNTAEAFRDPSHVRTSRVSEWAAFIHAAGFRMETIEIFDRRHAFDEWARRVLEDEKKVAELETYFLEAPSEILDVYRIEIEGDKVVSYTDEKGIFVLKKK